MWRAKLRERAWSKSYSTSFESFKRTNSRRSDFVITVIVNAQHDHHDDVMLFIVHIRIVIIDKVYLQLTVYHVIVIVIPKQVCRRRRHCARVQSPRETLPRHSADSPEMHHHHHHHHYISMVGDVMMLLPMCWHWRHHHGPALAELVEMLNQTAVQRRMMMMTMNHVDGEVCQYSSAERFQHMTETSPAPSCAWAYSDNTRHCYHEESKEREALRA